MDPFHWAGKATPPVGFWSAARMMPTAAAIAAIIIFAASLYAGCSKVADRTLVIHQMQSTRTYHGAFRLDTSGLPADAIEFQTESGEAGSPNTKILLNMNYQFEIAIRVIP